MRAGEMVGNLFRPGAHGLGKQTLGDAPMKSLALSSEEGAVGRVVDQRVVKHQVAVAGLHQSGTDQLDELTVDDRRIVRRRQQGQQVVAAELASEDGGVLRDGPHRTETVESCRQRVVQARRHGEAGLVSRRLGDLLDEQRDTVASGEDLVESGFVDVGPGGASDPACIALAQRRYVYDDPRFRNGSVAQALRPQGGHHE